MKWFVIVSQLLVLGLNIGRPEAFGFIPALVLGGGGVGLYNYKDQLLKLAATHAKPLLCYFECCNDRSSNKWINYQPTFVDLDRKIFGQHIAINVVNKSIRQHLKNDNPPKALVLSFHGYTGVGKNHLSRLIAKELYTQYRETGDSKFVNTLVATHFLTDNLFIDKARLRKFIEDGVTRCERSLFILDEVDKVPDKLLDHLIPYIESNRKIDGVSYNKAIFLLLGNSGGDAINAKTYELRSKGIAREDIDYHQFESILNSKAMREGGLKNAELIDRGVIDLFVPFLPLEREHIKLCISQYLQEHRNYTEPTVRPGTAFIERVANEISYIPDTDVYSRFGCKRVSATVDILLDDHQ